MANPELSETNGDKDSQASMESNNPSQESPNPQSESVHSSSPPNETPPAQFLSSDQSAEADSSEELSSNPEASDDKKKASKTQAKKRKRKTNLEVKEARLQGRKAICKSISDIAPEMLKTVKLRVLSKMLETTRGLDDNHLDKAITKETKNFINQKRIVNQMMELDPDVDRRNLKSIIIFGVLLQEEDHGLEERRLDEKVIEFEKRLISQSKKLDFFDKKKHDPIRWHHYETYRIVLEAAWKNDGDISADEAHLLQVLRDHLSISLEEHWLIGCHLKRFPKKGRVPHNPDEINNARKELQREAILWSYRDDSNRSIDIIPEEIVKVIREKLANQELQRVNYRRLLSNDSILLTDLKAALEKEDMDKNGVKSDLIERLATSDIRPSVVLNYFDTSKLSNMCAQVGLKTSGVKAEIIKRLIEFYDDLTFFERQTKDPREVWFNNYGLLASRSYSDLKAKKLISKDLEIEHQFEKATEFLFEKQLGTKIDVSRKITKADGRIPLQNRSVILWDCKSVESSVNLQDHLDKQFDFYINREREKGYTPLAFLVIGPSFTSQSIKLAHVYKARTNCDIALITAEALKELAEQWQATEGNKSFPINLLNRTELIDIDRVPFLISLT